MAILSIKNFDESVLRGAKIAAVSEGVLMADWITAAISWAVDAGFTTGSQPKVGRVREKKKQQDDKQDATES
jgi:hypothetical protein